MYFHADIIKFAFGLVRTIDANDAGKARQEKVSALRHLLATSELLKVLNKKTLDLSLSAVDNREAFKKAVADVVSIGNTGKYTIDFAAKFDKNIGASVSSNFLTTRVEKSRNATEAVEYPGRYGALLSLQAEKIKILVDVKKKLDTAYNFSEIKIPLVIWLLRSTELDLKTSPSFNFKQLHNSISDNIQIRFEPIVASALIPSEDELKSFLQQHSKLSSNLYDENIADIDSLISIFGVGVGGHFNLDQLVEVHSHWLDKLNSAGLAFDSQLVLRYLVSVLTKRFCILTGLAGSGKTKLAEAFAMWLCESADQYRIVAVGADWTSNENLLGYADALQAGQYRAPVNGALQLLLRAQADKDQKPYFLILDEMNLSHVERYFADFLSAMESDNAPLSLHGVAAGLALDGVAGIPVPATLPLPANLFIIGTVNVDETTYMFSPKVLDRANVIEFRATADQMAAFLDNPTGVDLGALKAQGVPFATAFVQRALADADIAALKDDTDNSPYTQFQSDLIAVFAALESAGAEFGFRSAKEMARFMVIHKELSGPGWVYKDALDAQVLQKLMPKLHGSARKLDGVLKALEEFATARDLTLSLEKIRRMKHRLNDGFTSFAEA